MKMETTLNAPFGGIVTAVNVAEGESVSPGQILIDIQNREAASQASDAQ
jgi:biotin carboxyl carrier protein